MSRTSEPLLSWLRDQIKQRGLNRAGLAKKTGLERARVRKILAGAEPMTVDELMAITAALELDAAEMMQLPEAPPMEVVPETQRDDVVIDPFGNHAEQIFRAAFALGCDFLFVADTEQLADSGVPASVLAQHSPSGQLPIRLEAAYHTYNEPRYGADGITLTLSFDALYDCTFPWASIRQIILFPEPPEAPADIEEEPAPTGKVPHLRLVT